MHAFCQLMSTLLENYGQKYLFSIYTRLWKQWCDLSPDSYNWVQYHPLLSRWNFGRKRLPEHLLPTVDLGLFQCDRLE